jgi:hypothetical protein
MPGDEAIGADQQRAVRLEPMRGGRHHISTSQLHTEARYIHRAVFQAAALRAPQLRSTPRHSPRQAKQHEAPSVQASMVEISRPLKVMTATCGARVPGSPAIAPCGATARSPPTRRVRPTSGTGGSPSSPPHSR